MTEKLTEAKERTAKARVYEAVWELYDMEAPITRDAVVRQTGLKTVTVDEALKSLKRDDKIISIERGLYAPAELPEETQAVSVTVLPRGETKIEVGDQILVLKPREARMLSPLFAGASAQAAVIEHLHRTFWLTEQLEKAKRRMAGLEEQLQANGRQMAL
ncbi:hypothetical protein [Comamonas sp.]|uniref:hypothetical protein n=1 Tax=Comamonas sp. TaxID=34028 RepID=UPI0028974A11|nr:hypothetical protein [Comamonas sp.]